MLNTGHPFGAHQQEVTVHLVRQIQELMKIRCQNLMKCLVSHHHGWHQGMREIAGT